MVCKCDIYKKIDEWSVEYSSQEKIYRNMNKKLPISQKQYIEYKIFKFLEEQFNPPKNTEYYFITDIDQKLGTIEQGGVEYPQYLGGFHDTYNFGGVQMRYRSADHFETPYTITVHEWGHLLGLPHPDEISKNKNIDISPIVTNKQTTNNFMDYFVKRTSWFREQMLKVHDTFKRFPIF